MIDQQHIINKKVFDVVYYDEKNVSHIQNRLSNLSSNDLSSTIEKILTEFSKENLTIKLDQIVLDLGHISEGNLENQIIERVKIELNKVLSEKIDDLRLLNGNGKEGIVNSELKEIELLEWFLLNGTLPWWFHQKSDFNINDLISSLIENSSNSILTLIKKQARTKNFIKRIVLNFKEDVLALLINKLSPIEAQLLIEIVKTTITVQSNNQIIKTDRETFKNKTWEFVLTYITVERGTEFNTKVFVRSLLYQLANYFNVDFLSFIIQFNSAISLIQKQVKLPNQLSEIIESIYLSEQNKKDKESKSKELKEIKIDFRKDKDWLKSTIQNDAYRLSEDDLIRFKSILESLVLKEPEYISELSIGKGWERFNTALKKIKLSNNSQVVLEKIVASSSVVNSNLDYQFNGLIYFLEMGSFSTQYFNISKNDIDKTIKLSINEKSAKFIKFIIEKGKVKSIRERLINILDESFIKKVINLIASSNAPKILNFAANIQDLKLNNTIKVNATNEAFTKIKWKFILKVLLVDRGSIFNLKSFVKLTLQQLAGSFNLEYSVLITQILIGLDTEESTSHKSELLTVLKSLQQEEQTIIVKSEIEDTKKYRQQTKLNWFQFIVENQSVPWWSAKHGFKLTELQNVLFDISKRYTEEIKTLLSRQFLHQQKRQFILSKLDEDGIVQIVRIIQPIEVDLIKTYTSILTKLHDQNNQLTLLNFNQYKWDVVIFSLLKNRGSHFNMKSFVMSTLHQMSHHFNVSFEALFSSLITLSDTVLSSRKSEFTKVILELKAEYRWQLTKGEVSDPKIKIEEEKKWFELNIETDVKLKEFFLLLYPFKNSIHWTFVQNNNLSNWLSHNLNYSPKSLKKIIKSIGFSKRERHFIFKQLSIKQQQVWLKALLESKDLFIKYYQTDLEKIIGLIKYLPNQKVQQHIQAFGLAYLFETENNTKHHYFEALIFSIMNEWGIKWADMEKELEVSINILKPQLLSTLSLSFSKMKSVKVIVPKLRDVINKNEAKGKEVEFLKEGSNLNKNTTNLVDEEIVKDTVIITNAGLVILWPFINQFFNMTNLLDGEKFKSEQEAVRATHLLQFLVTGKENHPEHDLYLNKIICGVPINTAIEHVLKLTEKEIEVANSLLVGVIGNWPGMGSTTVEALRETFLTREGLVSFEEEAIELRVQNKTVDILLDSLPWSYSIVKLPWMKKMIQVLWN